MKQINKTYYWIALIVLFTTILVIRYFGFLIEVRKEFFYAIFGLWVCLILLPLFGEIEFMGIKLKKELDSLKSDVKKEIQSIKNEFSSTNKQQVILGYGPPPTDSKISELEVEIDKLKVLRPKITSQLSLNCEGDYLWTVKESSSTARFSNERLYLR